MACGVILTAAPLSFTTSRFTRHSARRSRSGCWRVSRHLCEKQVPLEVETTRFFNVSLWSAPPSVYTTFVVALQSMMHFGVTTRWTTNSTKQTVPRVNVGERHGLQRWTSGLHAVESHWPVAGAFKVCVCEVSRAVRAIDITNRLQCLVVHAVGNNVCEERLMLKL